MRAAACSLAFAAVARSPLSAALLPVLAVAVVGMSARILYSLRTRRAAR